MSSAAHAEDSVAEQSVHNLFPLLFSEAAIYIYIIFAITKTIIMIIMIIIINTYIVVS